MKPAAFAAITVSLSIALLAQQRPLFRGGVELVEVDAVAIDGHGAAIRGLTRDDFEVREDGRPVTMTTFSAVDADAARTAADGRFVVLLLDNMITPPLQTTHLKTIARAFADRMGPHDVTGVAMVNGGASRTTTSRAEIGAAIDRFRFEGTGLFDARKHALDMLRSLARQLAPVPHRRKLLVCIGSAAIFLPTDKVGVSGLTYSGEWYDALTEGARANVAIYVIDPAGLSPRIPDDAIAFADATGGKVFTTNELDRAVSRVWDEAGHYYLIGYEVPTAEPRKKSHSIDVRAKAPGIEVRARQRR